MKGMAPLEEPRAAAARPSMISAKYRQKEERRKVLKMSVGKLRRIEDPESALCRSVLINNTVRRLQREQREAKQGPGPGPEPAPQPVPAAPAATSPAPREDWGLEPLEQAAGMVLDELEDVLSQFYMPPTPRMITSIDEDDDLETESPSSSASACSLGRRPSTGPRPPAKRARFERPPQDRVEDEDARALADPTNTLEDFKDDVCMRSKPLPRTPLSSANAPSGEEGLRLELCGRRFTGHDRENIAPLQDGDDGSCATSGVGGQVVAVAPPLQVQPYSCGQAHGQVSNGLVFHGFMATMES